MVMIQARFVDMGCSSPPICAGLINAATSLGLFETYGF